jgi:hypothetical protein
MIAKHGTRESGTASAIEKLGAAGTPVTAVRLTCVTGCDVLMSKHKLTQSTTKSQEHSNSKRHFGTASLL